MAEVKKVAVAKRRKGQKAKPLSPAFSMDAWKADRRALMRAKLRGRKINEQINRWLDQADAKGSIVVNGIIGTTEDALVYQQAASELVAWAGNVENLTRYGVWFNHLDTGFTLAKIKKQAA